MLYSHAHGVAQRADSVGASGGCVALTSPEALPYPPSVGQGPAETFAERLPRVVPEEEEDISHLSDEMADILYPGRRRRPFRMGVIFDAFEGPNYPRALNLAKRSPVYSESKIGSTLSHQAAFDVNQANVMRELYDIVGPITGTEVTVDGKKVPYARELWLPLYWFFLKDE